MAGVGLPVTKTLHDLGNGLFAYTQLPGSWGWSNAGLICQDGSGTPVMVYRVLNGLEAPETAALVAK